MVQPYFVAHHTVKKYYNIADPVHVRTVDIAGHRLLATSRATPTPRQLVPHSVRAVAQR
jgi:hypothetical protein